MSLRIPSFEAGSFRRETAFALRTCLAVLVTFGGAGVLHAAEKPESGAAPAFKQYCFGCHGKAAMGGINLQNLTAEASVGESFQHWERVAAALEHKQMPPEKMPQPSDEQRRQAVTWIRTKLSDYAKKHDGDPGNVTVRRLTSGEYAYTIRDLTGIDLRFDSDSASDSVGGEGFTNYGDVQFMQDANLERYLSAAKRVASHAVIGSGPLQFFEDPGKSGLELSAIQRITDIYWANGFRAAAGEGGKPFGLDRYGKAFYAAWRYKHRKALGEPNATLGEIAKREGVNARFAQHIWTVVHKPNPSYPTSEVIERWQKLPVPTGTDAEQIAATVRAGSEDIQKYLIDWPRWLFAAGSLAAGGAGDERALVISEATLPAAASHSLRFNVRGRKQKTAKLNLSAVVVDPNAKDKPVVIWRNAAVRIRTGNPRAGSQPPVAVSQQRPLDTTPRQPLRELLDAATLERLQFGKMPDGTAIGPDDFAAVGDVPVTLEVPLPDNAAGLQLEVQAELAPGQAGDAVMRLTITGSDEVRGRPVWALLANPENEGFKSWRADVLEFAENLPQVSHAEPAPSDNDPIPAPFDNTYNQPERNLYHYQVKYYRRDKFLVEKILDDTTRIKLDQAWNDLLGSFGYHDAILRFVAEKYKLDLQGKGIADLDEAQIEAFPEEPRKYIRPLLPEYRSVVKARIDAQPRHIEDAIQFASKAWRRPLSEAEKENLRSFYRRTLESSEEGSEIDHARAIRVLLTRILVAPAFLYRFEQPAKLAKARELSDWEMASRLSYFLWSSVPDDELRRAAAAGQLSTPAQLERQVKRMLADPKAERFSTEFFGQWLGFYRFDQFKGVDTTRFPEFTEEVKSAMYDEAVSFFEHIVRKDRPVREILSADYTFLNQALAKHYGIKKEIKATDDVELVEGAKEFQRGGVLRMGAVLTATSAPLRTSPVKRGDWVLRRILGTPTPPPPPDAGSLPADPKAFGGLSVFDRLEAHKRNPTCASCHIRIDPLGFPLESYDAVGRWRDQYADGKPVHDSATLPDKTPIAGVDGLVKYLSSQEKQVLRTLSNKLIGYALGRTVLASDLPLIERLTKDGGDATLSRMAAEIVASRQFRYRREGEGAAPAVTPRTTTAPNPKGQTAGLPAKKNPGAKMPDKQGGL